MDEIVLRVRRVQAAIRDAVIAQASAQTPEQMSSVSEEKSGDTIYAIDRVSEDLVRRLFR